ADPFARFTARLISTGTGGVLVINVNERSEKIVITTGMIKPSWFLPDVLALNALQKSMMLTPCGDRKSTRLNSSHLVISYAVFCYAHPLHPPSFPTRRSSALADPFARYTARLISTGTGGVLVINVNKRSEKIVITTGMIKPSWSLPDVLALYALLKSMMLTPR